MESGSVTKCLCGQAETLVRRCIRQRSFVVRCSSFVVRHSSYYQKSCIMVTHVQDSSYDGVAKTMLDRVPPGLSLINTFERHKSRIYAMTWSPDGSTLAAGYSDGSILLWDASTGDARQTLAGHSDSVLSLAWSPHGRILASASSDKTIRLWDVATGHLGLLFTGHLNSVQTIAWSPDGRTLASGSLDKSVRLWDIATGEERQTLIGHTSWVFCVAWSPDGHTLASGSFDQTIRLWNGDSGQQTTLLSSHNLLIASLAWSPDGHLLASGSRDNTIRIWDMRSERQMLVLEGHTSVITQLHFSADGRLLASASGNGAIRLWRRDSWEMVALLYTTLSPDDLPDPLVAFHPHAPVLATTPSDGRVLHLWKLDLDRLVTSLTTIYYTNAKVVLLGDTGVGKSGLGLVLTGQPFAPTESTHSRRVWLFDTHEVELDERRRQIRETFLWDLAGQPGYRLIHQLHLNEVAVALVVFDARSETDPFAGVQHWGRALRQAIHTQGTGAWPIKKFLVAARIDCGGISVSRARIDALIRELGFDGYFETSAREGWGIIELAAAIRAAIPWPVLPQVSSTDLFQRIKTFLMTEHDNGRMLASVDELYHTFLHATQLPVDSSDLRAEFETCIGRVESRGLIRRLSFGNLVLLQPELLDTYASALVNAAREEPDGLGSIATDAARDGRFRMSPDERVRDELQEHLLLIATVEDLLRHEIALREQSEGGDYLVFPSQFTRELTDLPDPVGKEVIFTFEGAVLHVYTTLAVRLAHSHLFHRQEMWKNAATYTALVGGTCGIFLRQPQEGHGELTLFFDTATSEETRFLFEATVEHHVQRRALPESIHRRRVFVCPTCATPVTEKQVVGRRERQFSWIACNVCETRISLLDRNERLESARSSLVSRINSYADQQRDRSVATSTLEGKIATNDFDVFLCHNSTDRPVVKRIAQDLKSRGILPWLDEWELVPGQSIQDQLSRQIEQIKTAAIFFGPSGLGPWQNEEQKALLGQFARRKCPIIPVILPDCIRMPELPIFLQERSWVDFRKADPDPLEQLIWGITGHQPR